MSALLEVSNLSRRFGARVALCGLDCTLERGEVLGLLGPNGAGKSTCLKLLSGNLAPSAGAVRIDGLDLARRPLAAKTRLGYLPERAPVYPELTVDEYLTFAGRLHRLSRRGLAAARERVKTQCGLGEVGARLLGRLSKGYRQRAAVAQALLHAPPLLIFDEPTDGLDPVQAREFRDLIRALVAGPDPACGAIVSSHALAQVQAISSKVIILHEGRVVHQADLTTAASAGPMLFLRLCPPPVLASLLAVPAVAAALPEGPDGFRVTLAAGEGSAALVRALVERGFGVLEVTPGQSDLERVFFQTIGTAA